ncbi:TPA: hypothetical protein IAA87_02185 [Candidatus Avigastranaerophilus faecigallinarum]|nr:hypothetical protein [Candidatus Avigastranaerophilus faecigallinarum]
MIKLEINKNPYLYTSKISKTENANNRNHPLSSSQKNSYDKFTYENKSNLRKEFEETEKQQGIIGKAWDGIKNIFGAKSGSKHVEKVIKQAERGEISQEEAKEALNKYKEGQKTCIDVVADLASGILAVGAFALAVPTGGASLAVGLGIATAVGAGVKVGIKAGDALATGKEYKGKDLLYDTLTGGINGVLAPITNGLGNTVTKTIGKKLGLKIIQEGAEEAAEQGIKLGIKQTAKNIVLNQTIDVAEGTIGKRALALGAGMAIDGALGGASDNMLRAGLNGENVIEAGIQGAIGGAIMAPVIGGGFRVAGNAGKALNNKITTKIVLPDGINTKFKQGQTGDCALLSTIDGMMNNPNTAKTFKKSITKTINGDYNVKIGDKIVKVAKSSLSDDMLSDKTGIRIFEQAYKQLTGDIDGGFAEVVAKQFGLNPVHIANESITDELLDTLATNKSNTVLSLGTLVDTDGAISPIGSQRHYFTIKDIDSAKKTVKLTSPIDTSKTIELSYDDVKALGISIDGGTIKKLELPNIRRKSNDEKFFAGSALETQIDIIDDEQDIIKLLGLNRKNRKIFNRIINSRGNYVLDSGTYTYYVTKRPDGKYEIERIKNIIIESIFNLDRIQKLPPDSIYNSIQNTDIPDILRYIKTFSLNNNLSDSILPEYIGGTIDEEHIRLICYAVISSQIFDESGESALIRALQDYKKASMYKQINGRLRDKNFPISQENIFRVKKDIAELTEFINNCPRATDNTPLYRTDHYSVFSQTIIEEGIHKGEILSEILEEVEKRINKGEQVDTNSIKQMLKGKEFIFPGFLSTSLTNTASDSCGRESREIAWKFQTKGCVSGIFIDAFGKENWSCKELEYLIQRGSKVRIKDIEFLNGRWNINAEIISMNN